MLSRARGEEGTKQQSVSLAKLWVDFLLNCWDKFIFSAWSNHDIGSEDRSSVTLESHVTLPLPPPSRIQLCTKREYHVSLSQLNFTFLFFLVLFQQNWKISQRRPWWELCGVWPIFSAVFERVEKHDESVFWRRTILYLALGAMMVIVLLVISSDFLIIFLTLDRRIFAT